MKTPSERRAEEEMDKYSECSVSNVVVPNFFSFGEVSTYSLFALQTKVADLYN